MYKFYKVNRYFYIALDEKHDIAKIYITQVSSGWTTTKINLSFHKELVDESKEISEEDLIDAKIPLPHKDNLRRKLLNKY